MSGLITAAVVGAGGSYLINRSNRNNLSQAAQQQGDANLQAAREQAAMNNPNISTPYSSTMWTESTTPGGRPSVTQTLSPDEQWAYNQNNMLRSAQNSRLMESFPALTARLNQPFGLAGSPMMGLDPRFAPNPNSLQSDPNLYKAGPLQTGLDYSGVPGMPVASDQTRQAVTDAVYRQGARFLDPQFKEQQDAMTTALANQGITQGTVAAQRAQDAYDRSRTLAYGDLGDRATQQGIAAMDKLFGEQLAARSQGVGEVNTQGQFTNAAQLQGINELLAQMNARNQGATTAANIANQSTGAYNAARGQMFNEDIVNRTVPINLYNAMRSGAQANIPALQATTPTSITPAPVLAGAQGQAQLNAANASSNNQIFGGLVNAGLNYYQQQQNQPQQTNTPLPSGNYGMYDRGGG